jgi:hypothetical protein
MKAVNLIFSTLSVFFKAFVVWKLYVWFIQPLGFPILTMSEVFGVSLFWGLWFSKSTSIRQIVIADKDDKVDLTVTIISIIIIGISLLLGYILK